MKILVMAPIVPDPNWLSNFYQTLTSILGVKPQGVGSGMNCQHPLDHDICLKDSLTNPNTQEGMFNLNAHDFFNTWKVWFKANLTEYDAFIGFSFGGMILHACFSVFETTHKPLIFISTPLCLTNRLRKRLTHILKLSLKDHLNEALRCLYKAVYAPYETPSFLTFVSDPVLVKHRLIYGLELVLNTNLSAQLMQFSGKYLHLFGDQSELVRKSDSIVTNGGCTCLIPEAGMRVLENNPTYSKAIINHWLLHQRAV